MIRALWHPNRTDFTRTLRTKNFKKKNLWYLYGIYGIYTINSFSMLQVAIMYVSMDIQISCTRKFIAEIK